MRIEKSKTTLKKQLQFEISDRQAGLIDTAVIDGSALFWVIPYPAEDLVEEYLSIFSKCTSQNDLKTYCLQFLTGTMNTVQTVQQSVHQQQGHVECISYILTVGCLHRGYF